MKHKRFKKEHSHGPRGFTRWIQPEMAKYMMVCCDCGLVHEFQFRIAGVRVQKVQFRCRRAERYTKVERGKRKS